MALKPTNKSYRTDETYIKVKGEHKYLYRAVRRLNYEFAMDRRFSDTLIPSANTVMSRCQVAEHLKSAC